MEKNAASRRMLVEQSARWRMIAESAETAEQALELFRTGKPFDIAVLDLQLEGPGGVALAGELRKLPGGAMLPADFAHAAGCPGRVAGRCPWRRQTGKAGATVRCVGAALLSPGKEVAAMVPRHTRTTGCEADSAEDSAGGRQ